MPSRQPSSLLSVASSLLAALLFPYLASSLPPASATQFPSAAPVAAASVATAALEETALVAPRFPSWHATSTASVLHSARQEAVELGLLNDADFSFFRAFRLAARSTQQSRLQTQVYELLIASTAAQDHTAALAFFERRLKRFPHGIFSRHLRFRLARVTSLIRYLPDCIKHSVMQTWGHAWRTHHRFQKIGACIIQGCSGYDSLAHYSYSRFFRQLGITSGVLPPDTPPSPPPSRICSFLLLQHAVSAACLCRHPLHLHLLLRVHSASRRAESSLSLSLMLFPFTGGVTSIVFADFLGWRCS